MRQMFENMVSRWAAMMVMGVMMVMMKTKNLKILQ